MKTIRVESIILSAFIYDANQPFSFCFLIGNEAVQLSNLKRGLITLIIEAYNKMRRLFFYSFHG